MWCTNALVAQRASILLLSESNQDLGGESVRAFQFDTDFKKTVQEATVLDAKEGPLMFIDSWIETGENGITLSDSKEYELVDMKII